MTGRISRNILWAATGAYWLFLFIMTHIPQGRAPELGVSDKLEHFVAYGLLAGLFFLCLWTPRRSALRTALLAAGIALAYGAVDEWLQAIPFINRSCELNDWLADAGGIGLAMLILVPVRFVAGGRQGNRET